MVFSSILFILFFLPAFVSTYYFAPKKLKNIVILLFSIVFYSWGAPRFIFVILGTTFLDFHLVRWMSQSKRENQRRLLLALSVSINLGLLVYFKYSNFFVENLNAVLSLLGSETHIHWTKLVLPIGISFYTFESITYVVDVYRRVHKPLSDFWNYQLYIIFFPKLIAGPIVRYHDLADQIEDRSANETVDNILTGFYRFAIGMAKKVLIANQMGVYADSVFALNYADVGTATAWFGILAYTFQIYFDFAGYSDMAIGIARMVGFRFPENFNNPYVSQSITEFWRRWHMTLGAWMRDYLYIPLGGNRVSTPRLYFNLWFVFLASGLWHGASWNFIFWGAYHGLFLVLERAFLLKVYKKIGALPRVLITFFLVAIGWVFFRIEHFGDAIAFVKRLFAFEKGDFAMNPEFFFYLFVAVIFSFITFFTFGKRWNESVFFANYDNKKHITMFVVVLILLIFSIASISAFGFNPFIYFRF
ncbi:MAG: MBOAT family protein [Bacteroidales bacterium]|jgi:alginate O-acetyltransferase complex protein AlgI|nr:MBOAT family protein [Bacteroidales bacterium]